MSETELRVVCKSCGAEVSPYVTECPYCGARVRKRAPKLERRDGGLEAKKSRKEKRQERRASKASRVATDARPYATMLLILVPAVAMLVRIASGGSFETYGALAVPFDSDWWRFFTAPFAYLSVGYLFAVSLAIALFVPGLERRLGTVATLIMLFACGSLGMLAAYGIEEQRAAIDVIGGGNGIALGAIGAWFVIRRRERGPYDDPVDVIGVIVCAVVILLLPAVVETANVWSGLAGGAVGALAGLAANLGRR